jgi:hypothetical protein
MGTSFVIGVLTMFEVERSKLVAKFKNNPNEVTKEDLTRNVSFYALKTYMWETKNWGGTTNIGKFTISHGYEPGLLSNSRKSRTTPNQHQFTITDTETNETWKDGIIIPTSFSNRRSRGGRFKLEK